MKAKLVLLLILIVLFAGFVGVKFFLLDKKNEVGQLKILSSPSASIFINNVAVGKTPFYDKYKVGDYILKLIPEGTATDTASWQGKINVYKNSLTYINRELGSSDISSAGEVLTVTKMEKAPSKVNLGEIYVETEPQGAIIYLDNDEKGVAPLILEEVVQGEHELSVFLPGFLRRTQKINVEPGYRINASFKLAIDLQAKTSLNKTTEAKPASASAEVTNAKNKVVIKETPTGWLRVREEPSINASESARVNPGEKFDLLDEQNGWYQIEYEAGKKGWISAEYASKE